MLAYLRIAEANCTKVVPADPDCASRIATHGGFKPLHPKFAPHVDAYNFTAEWHASVLTIDAKLNYTVGPDPNISYQMTLDNDYDSSHHDYKEGETSGHPQTIVLAPKGLTTVTVTVVREGSVDTPPCNASYAVQIGRKAVPPPKKKPKRSKAKKVFTVLGLVVLGIAVVLGIYYVVSAICMFKHKPQSSEDQIKRLRASLLSDEPDIDALITGGKEKEKKPGDRSSLGWSAPGSELKW